MNFMKILHKLGNESPNAVLAVIALNCVANATIRPLITLINPHETMTRKKYAALRESLTEFIAIPVVVGLAFGFKGSLAPIFFKKQSEEINKDVIRKIFTAVGLSIGNMIIPFVATVVIGGLFKTFPGLRNKKTTLAPEPLMAPCKAPETYTFNQLNPKKISSPIPCQTYTNFRPSYRTTFL